MLICDLRRVVALTLVLSTVAVTMPVSAADFSMPKSVIGSVSAVGPVALRGIGISQEGTLFPGDSIRSGQKGYAKVLLGTGSKIEISEKSDVSVNRDQQGIKIAMNTGTVGFTAQSPLRIDVLPFEVTASDGASGNVSVMSATAAGVRAINGRVTVRNVKTSESFVLTKGQERLLGLRDGAHTPALAELASNVPGPIPAPSPSPAPAPQTPAGRTGGGIAMDKGAWLAVAGVAALTGLSVWGLVVALNNRDDIKDNKAALKNVSNASALSSTVAQQQAQLSAIIALSAQAQLALTAAGNTAAAAQAASLASQATAAQGQLNSLQNSIQSAQAQLAGGGSSSNLAQLIQQEEQLRNTVNSLSTQLNNLLSANRNTLGVPNTSVGTVPPPVIASASIPA